MITRFEILKGREKNYPLTGKKKSNLNKLHYRISIVRFLFGLAMIVTSGLRTPWGNKAAGGSTDSKHMQCAAIDIRDVDGKLWKWCMDNLDVLEKLGLWLEDRSATPTWVHFQIFPPRSGKRIFLP